MYICIYIIYIYYIYIYIYSVLPDHQLSNAKKVYLLFFIFEFAIEYSQCKSKHLSQMKAYLN